MMDPWIGRYITLLMTIGRDRVSGGRSAGVVGPGLREPRDVGRCDLGERRVLHAARIVTDGRPVSRGAERSTATLSATGADHGTSDARVSSSAPPAGEPPKTPLDTARERAQYTRSMSVIQVQTTRQQHRCGRLPQDEPAADLRGGRRMSRDVVWLVLADGAAVRASDICPDRRRCPALGQRSRDQSGGALPGVEVTVTQTDTGHDAVRDHERERWLRLHQPSGRSLQLSAQLSGFSIFEQTGIVLASATRARSTSR